MKSLISSAFISLVFLLFPLCVAAQHPVNLKEFEDLLKKAVTEKDQAKAAFYCYEIGKIHINNGQPEKATDYLARCLNYGKSGSDKMLMYLAHQELGLVLTESGNHNKALDNFQKAVKLAEELKKKEFMAEGLILVATSYSQSGKVKRAIDPLEKALTLSVQQNDLLLQQKCYELLAAYHKQLGNSTKSKEYQSLYDNLALNQQYQEQNEKQRKELEEQKKTTHSQLARQSQKLRLAEDSLLATKYFLKETEQSLKEVTEISEKRQLQIDLLNKEQELAAMRISEQAANLRNEKLIRNSIIVVALMVTSLVVVMVRSYRRQIEANKKIDQQNKSIKSSINYAKRIQEAMLPKKDRREALLPESFVFFKPRDLVSGDFYWFSEIKSWYNPDVVFAAADCTGHGIPGALMSMIGINALNGIIAQGIAESDQILNALSTEIKTALQQEMTGNNDGLDIALCIYRKEKSILEFSGAKNPLIYIQDNKLFQIKGDVHPIGGSRSKNKFTFQKHRISIDQPTMVYIFSDGYRDQFGGPENIKFMSKRFNDLLLSIHQMPLNEQSEILRKNLETWQGNHQQTDDILVMGVRLDSAF